MNTPNLYGAYSPIDGASVVVEIEQVNLKIFERYLAELSAHQPTEYKIVVIDNAGFHNRTNLIIPDNIYLLAIPPYSPELNPCEQVWAYVKERFKNCSFTSLKQIKNWLHSFVEKMTPQAIQAIVANRHYLNAFYAK